MKRLLPAVALALALAAPATAKEVTSLTVCGTNGCDTTRDKDELRSLMEVQPQPTPDHSGAFLQVRFAVRAGTHDSGVIRSQWIPSLGLMRHDDGAMTEFTLPYPASVRTLNRLSEGLHPFPARPIRQQTARVSEVVQPPARDEDGGGAGWALSALAVLPAGLVFVMRRRGHWK